MFFMPTVFFCPLYGSYIATEKRKSGRTIFFHDAHTSRECQLLVKLELESHAKIISSCCFDTTPTSLWEGDYFLRYPAHIHMETTAKQELF